MSETPEVPSSKLIEAIRRERDRRGLNQPMTAAVLGISNSYLAKLLNGERSFTGLDPSKVHKLAKFLHVPSSQVRKMMETVTVAKDFSEESINYELDRMYERMLDDHQLCLTPKKSIWQQIPLEVKCFVAMIYERATHEEFLTKADQYQVKHS